MDSHKQSEDETPPLCIDEGEYSSVALSSRRKRLTFLLPLWLIGALLYSGTTRFPIARGETHPDSHLSSVHTLTTSAPLTSQQVIERDQPAIVKIIDRNCQNQPEGHFGSGEIIDPRGYIVTNYHVIANMPKFSVQLFDNSQFPADLIGVDPADDLAVLKMNTSKHLSVISIGNSSRLQVGENVLAIGYPLIDQVNQTISPTGETPYGFQVDGATITGGLISALGRRQITPVEGVTSEITDAIQSDAEINPGNSGGALVDMRGHLVGITEETLTYANPYESITPANVAIKGIGFSIPSNRVMFVVPQLIQHGRMIQSGHTIMNTTLVSVNPELAALDDLTVDHGAYISSVASRSPAALAGLRRGDVIVQVNETPITNAMDVNDALMSADAGTTVTLGVVRGATQIQVHAELQELPISVKIAPVQQCPSSHRPIVGNG